MSWLTFLIKESEKPEEQWSPQREELRRIFRSLPEPKDMSQHTVDRVLAAMNRTFETPIEGGNYRLELVKPLEVSEIPDPFNHKEINKALKARKGALSSTYGPTVSGEFRVVNKNTGEEVATKKLNLGKIPTVTRDRSYLVNGKKRFMMHQWRRNPGVFAIEDGRGDIVTEFNLDPATVSKVHNFKVLFDSTGDSLDYKLVVGQSKGVSAWDLAKLLGATPEDLKESIGESAANSVMEGASEKRYRKNMRNLYQRFFPDKNAKKEDFKNIEIQLRDQFNTTKIDPGIAKVTMGTEVDRVNKDILLSSFSKMRAMANGEVRPDDRESIAQKKILSPADLLAESIGRDSTITSFRRGVASTLRSVYDNRNEVRIDQILKQPFRRKLEDRASKSMVQRADTSTTPLDAFAQATTTTILGEGAIASEMGVPKDAKLLNPGSVGFLDPVQSPECHSEDTEVFTSRGWIPIHQIDECTLFACRIEDRMEFHKAERIHKAPYKGPMYCAQNRHIGYKVTPNHRLWCRSSKGWGNTQWSFQSPADCHNKVRIYQCAHAPFVGGTQTHFRLPLVEAAKTSETGSRGTLGSRSLIQESLIDINDWAEFFGWWVSEGGSYVSEKTSDYHVTIHQSKEANPEHCARIEALLNRLPWNWSNTDNAVYTLSTKQLAVYLHSLGNTYVKHLPEECFHWPLDARQLLMESLMLGDGRVKKARSGNGYFQYVYTTVSPQLAKDVERLGVGLGWPVSMNSYEDPREERYRDVFEIRMLQRPEWGVRRRSLKSKVVEGVQKRWREETRSYSIEHYEGIVYCATVPGGLMYVRRNTTTGHWSGNSARAGYILNFPTRTRVVLDEDSVTSKDIGHSKLLADVVDAKGEDVEVTPRQMVNKVLGSFTQWEKGKDGKLVPKTDENGQVEGWRNGEVVLVDPKEVTYWLKDPGNMFSANTGLIPFANSIQGGRMGYADKQTVQSLPLKYREAPIVRTKAWDTKYSNEELLAEEAGAVRAGVDGTIKSIGEDEGERYIELVPKGKKKPIRISLPKNMPLGGGTPMDSEIRVEKGQKVKRGELLADSTFTKDGVMASGVNLRAGYLPYHTSTFEDSATISESAARKGTSLHLYEEGESDGTIRLGKKNWRKMVSTPLPETVADKLDDDGVIKIGETIDPGDYYMVGMRSQRLAGKETLQRAKNVGLYKSKDRRGQDRGETWVEKRWSHTHSGEVVDVKKERDRDGNVIGARVYVRTEEPLQVGDKVFGRHANKATIAEIVPDDLMPRNEKGEHLEIIYNPAAVTGRMNVTQNFETYLADVAREKGKPELVENYKANSNWDYVQKKLDESGVSDGEDLYDPRSGKTLRSIGTGPQYILKAKQQVDHKSSGRGIGAFQESGLASKGKDGAQSIGELGLYGALSQNARNFIRGALLYSSENRPEVWAALAKGQSLPAGRVPASFVRFQNYLKAAGVDMEQDHKLKKFTLKPVTDKDVISLAKSGGTENVITEPRKTIQAGTVKPQKNGLFDPKVTGGRGGEKWSRFELEQKIPNPLYEQAIRDVLGVKPKQFNKIMAGTVGVKTEDGEKYGAEAIEHMLASADLESVRQRAFEQAKSAKKSSARSSAYRTLRTIDMLKKNELEPEDAFMRKQVLVLPANMRDIKVDNDTGDFVVGDVNYLYRDLALINDQLKDAKSAGIHPKARARLESGLYAGMLQLMQTEGSAPISGADYQGIVGTIIGKRPSGADGKEAGDLKQSLLKKELLQRRQIMSGRTVIGPNGDLGLDQIYLPRKIAAKIYGPLLEAEWQKSNPTFSASRAGRNKFRKFRTELNEYANHGKRSKEVDRVLERTVRDRWVALKRDPVLHKYGIQGMEPLLTNDETIQVNPLVVSGFGADFDGDSVADNVIVYFDQALDNGVPLSYSVADISSFPDELRNAATEEGIMHTDEILTSGWGSIHIKDFPHLKETKVVKKGGRVEEYDVPPGVRVPAYLPGGNMEMLPVTKWSIHHDCKEHRVHFASGLRVTASQDHSLAVLDPDTLEVVKSPPRKSHGFLVPTLSKLAHKESYHTPERIKAAQSHWRYQDEEDADFKLDADLGWWLGACIGDGWVNSAEQICLAFGDAESERAVALRWAAIVQEKFNRPCGEVSNPHEFDGKPSVSYRMTFTRTEIAPRIADWIGKGSQGKHLPPWFVSASEEVRRGLLCGLIDTDGSCSWSKEREVYDKRRGTSYIKKPQFMCTYSTKSERLAREFVILASTVGIQAAVTPHTRKGRTTEYVVYLATQDVQNASEWFTLTHTKKRSNLEKLFACDTVKPNQKAIAPMPSRIEALLKKIASDLGGTKKTKETEEQKQWFTWYCTVSRRKGKGSMPLQTSQDIARYLRDSDEKAWKNGLAQDDVAYLLKWSSLVLSDSVRWDQITKVETTGRTMTMWDLTVPDSWTFTCANGIVVWDTMAVFVPIPKSADRDLREKMAPSANLFSMASGDLMYTISHEAISGLHRISRDPKQKKPVASFEGLQDARQAFIDDTIEPNDLVEIGGRKTTYGRALIDDALPDGMSLDSLRKEGVLPPNFGEIGLSKKDIRSMSTHIAKTMPEAYGTIANKLREVGSEQATLTGMTLLMEDLKPVMAKERKQAQVELRKEVSRIQSQNLSHDEKQERLRKLYDSKIGDIASRGMQMLRDSVSPKDGSRSNVSAEMTFSGARVKPIQLQQVNFGPGAMIDGKGDVVATPVMKSYSEGLSPTEHWATFHGSRMGNISKVVEVQDPGFLTKQVVNTAMDMVVTSDDCGTSKGLAVDINRPKDDLYGRFLAKPVSAGKKTWGAGEVLTGTNLSLMRQKNQGKVFVRSPATCEAPSGICSKCVGALPDGTRLKIGENFGIQASQAIGERSTQLTLSTFHAGGVYEPGSDGGARNLFNEASALLRMPKTMNGNKATVSPFTGTISALNRNEDKGGFDLEVESRGSKKSVFLPFTKKAPNGSSYQDFFKVGEKVEAGDVLTSGLASPKEILEHTKDIEKTRKYMIDRLGNLFSNEGVLRRNVEGVVRAMTSTVEVADPGDSDLLPGQRIKDQTAADMRKRFKNFSFRPILRGVDVAPREFQEDFLARMNFNNLRSTLVQSAQMGATSNYKSTNPIPAMSYAAEFNRATRAGGKSDTKGNY